MSKHRPASPVSVRPNTPDELAWFGQDRGVVKGPFDTQVEAWDAVRRNEPEPHPLAQVWCKRKS